MKKKAQCLKGYVEFQSSGNIFISKVNNVGHFLVQLLSYFNEFVRRIILINICPEQVFSHRSKLKNKNMNCCFF